MLFPATSTDTLVTRHFSRLAAPDAIARVELFYLPVILTTHAAFFLSCLWRASLAFLIASGECWRAEVTYHLSQLSQDYHAATLTVKGRLP